MPDKSTESKPTDQSQQDEIARLRAQNKQLQDELARKEGSAESPSARRDTSQVLRDFPDRFIGEANRILRALTLSCLEPLRAAGDIVSALTDEISRGTQPEERAAERGWSRERAERRSRSETMNLPRDIYAGFIKAVDRSLDIPSKMVDRFYDTYRGAETRKTG